MYDTNRQNTNRCKVQTQTHRNATQMDLRNHRNANPCKLQNTEKGVGYKPSNYKHMQRTNTNTSKCKTNQAYKLPS